MVHHVHDALEILMMSLAIGMDVFSLAVGLGLQGLSRRRGLWLAVCIAVAHVLMTLAGLYVGWMLQGLIGELAKWFGAALLIGLGLHMVWATLFASTESVPLGASLGGALLFAGGVSLDALSVGFSLGLRSTAYGIVSAVSFGIAAGILCVVGILIGKRANRLTGTYGQLLGAAILLGYGVHFLLA